MYMIGAVTVSDNQNVIEYYTGLPVSGKPWRVTSPYGNRLDPWGSGKIVFHPGIDFGDRPAGDPIRFPFPGIVTASAAQMSGGKYVGAGNYVSVKIDGHPVVQNFFHLLRRAVKVGQRVAKGDVGGYNGKTGNATGAHLHYELRNYVPGGNPTGVGVWGDPALFRMTAKSLKYTSGAVVKTTGNNLNFRAAPGTTGTIVGSLERGTMATVVNHADNGIFATGHHWCYVALIDNQKGWLAESYLELVPVEPGEIERLKAEIARLEQEKLSLAAELGIAGGKIADAVKVLTR